MKKIINPYARISGYNCFGCSPNNEPGLQMEFYEDGEWILSRWKPKPQFHGYGDILHGGIQSTLLDEISAWVINLKLETAGLTSSIDVKFKKAVHTSEAPITIRAKLQEQTRKMATIYGELLNDTNEVCTIATVKYFIFSENVAREKLYYPGIHAFYEQP
ncbi:MAG: PaaI family thioesterase [Bacteroidales bacterium]|jgi:acyl-coenzyme A thioesterase PaaI-like protein|nr:PaaI family thioesterase [Bacteroidales bacterium]